MVKLPKELARRRVPHVVLGYAAISWGFLEFTNYVVDILLISPHWNRVALAAVLLVVPSVVMLAYNHGAPGKDRWTTMERLGIGTNLVVALGVLLVLFGRVDLGAAMTSISVEDDEGNTVERAVVKQEFRKRIVTYVFDLDETLEDEESWLAFLVDDAIGLDLSSYDFIECWTRASSGYGGRVTRT